MKSSEVWLEFSGLLYSVFLAGVCVFCLFVLFVVLFWVLLLFFHYFNMVLQSLIWVVANGEGNHLKMVARMTTLTKDIRALPSQGCREAMHNATLNTHVQVLYEHSFHVSDECPSVQSWLVDARPWWGTWCRHVPAVYWRVHWLFNRVFHRGKLCISMWFHLLGFFYEFYFRATSQNSQ